jgi:hypothetical protein
MEWEVLFAEEFAEWLDTLGAGLRTRIAGHVELLERFGPRLGRPRVDTVKGSAYANMKELRVQYQGEPWRILFAFDSRRRAILLVGGNKTGDKRWYEEQIRIADARYRRHLKSLKDETRGGRLMAIKARDYIAKLPESEQKAIQAEAQQLIAEELTLAELREARRRSQAELAQKLGVQQSAISRLERRTDMYLSTLSGVVEAMGGSIEIIARFPDRPPVRINQIKALGQSS